MYTSLLKYWYLPAMVAISAILAVQSFRLNICKADFKELTHQIEQLEVKSKESQQRALNAKEQAEALLKSSKKDIDRIMSSNVPSDCNGAVNWAIGQAKIIG